MGRAPCCSKVGLHRGVWSDEEDKLLTQYIQTHGEGQWRSMPSKAGLLRCGKSCRLRWMNYLRPRIKRGNFTAEEEENIIRLHSIHGSRWSFIATELTGRTDNEIKNYWNSHLKRKLAEPADVISKKPTKKKRKTTDQGKSTKVAKTSEEAEEKVVSQSSSSSSNSLIPSSKSESSSSAVDQGEAELLETEFCWPNWSPLLEIEGTSSMDELLDMSLDGLDSLMMKHDDDDSEMLNKLYDEYWLLIQDGDGDGL